MTSTTPSASHRFESSHDLHSSPPRQVRWGVMLLWASLAFTVAEYLFSVPSAVNAWPTNQVARGAAIFGLTVPLALFLLDTYLNTKIIKRKNWARIMKLVLVLASLLLQLMLESTADALTLFSTIVVNVLNFSALYLLFATRARLWYRQL